MMQLRPFRAHLSEELICEFRVAPQNLREELLGVFFKWTFGVVVARRRPCRLWSRHFVVSLWLGPGGGGLVAVEQTSLVQKSQRIKSLSKNEFLVLAINPFYSLRYKFGLRSAALKAERKKLDRRWTVGVGGGGGGGGKRKERKEERVVGLFSRSRNSKGGKRETKSE